MSDRVRAPIGKLVGYGVLAAYFVVSVAYLNGWVGLAGLVVLSAVLIVILRKQNESR